MPREVLIPYTRFDRSNSDVYVPWPARTGLR
jgi:hypothetical protein